MLTAKKGDEVLEETFRCGADDYLAKPIVSDELRQRIEQGRSILERQDGVAQKIDELVATPSESAGQIKN